MHYLKTMKEMRSSPLLTFTLSSYADPITVITTANENNSYYKRYKKLLQDENQKFIDWGTGNMNAHMLEKVIDYYAVTYFPILFFRQRKIHSK